MFKRILHYLKHKPFKEFTKIEGWLSFKEAHTLYTFSKKIGKNATIVEIGSWQGKSTYCLAKGLKKGSKIIAIDPFNSDGELESKVEYQKLSENKSLIDLFWSNLKGYENNIIVKKGYSNDFVDEIGTIDFLFIDGDHSIEGCSFDFQNYSPKLKRKGIVAIHDYYPDRKELGTTFVIEQIALNNNSYETVGVYDSLWVARKLD